MEVSRRASLRRATGAPQSAHHPVACCCLQTVGPGAVRDRLRNVTDQLPTRESWERRNSATGQVTTRASPDAGGFGTGFAPTALQGGRSIARWGRYLGSCAEAFGFLGEVLGSPGG